MSKREELIETYNHLFPRIEQDVCLAISKVYLYDKIFPIMNVARGAAVDIARYDSYISRVGHSRISQRILDRKMDDVVESIATLEKLIAEFWSAYEARKQPSLS